MNWHFHVQMKNGELSALIVSHPGNCKPDAVIVGEMLQPAWQYLGTRSTLFAWRDQDALRNLWIMATRNEWPNKWKVGQSC